ncbi:MAG: hypothetical protein HKP58_15735 [Desulfatitalea sp.]|nr:hypothetical protein [Desulfatitalea sp.]NNK01862.1 hypothetical protein [Desulfatitalea sp.]
MYFIGNFQYVSDQQDNNEHQRRHGMFSMMIQVDSSKEALDHFKQRLIEFRRSSTFFEGQCTIYINQLLEFDQMPQHEAVMLNFKSYAGDPLLPYIACVVPSEQHNACKIHEWQNNQPLTDGHEDRLFLEFV